MSGLLYFIAFAMWAVVTVPIWLRSRDERNIEQTIAIQEGVEYGWRWAKREPLTGIELAYARRRRTLMVLLTLLVASFLGGTSGAFSPLWIAPPVLLIALFAAAAMRFNQLHQPKPVKVTAPTKAQRPVVANVTPEVTAVEVPAPPVTVIDSSVVADEAPAQVRTWAPTPLPEPDYVIANRATVVPRNLDADRPWTGQDMVAQAELIRATREARMQEAQLRIEQARALATEKARQAAIAAAARIESKPEIRKAAGD
jgi:hypothetical protein